MEIFLSQETQTPTSEIIAALRKTMFETIKQLFNSEFAAYGVDVETLSIITVCVSTTFLADSGWKERIRYDKKEKRTDIRLNIDYESFINSTHEEQQQMYCCCIRRYQNC